MNKYAGDTSVSVDRTMGDIRRTLMRFGASMVAPVEIHDQQGSRAGVLFANDGISYRITMGLPSKDDRRFTHTPSRGKLRPVDQARREWEQACRSKWRALLLYVKGLVVAVDEGILAFEETFLTHAIGPDSRTVVEIYGPELRKARDQGRLPDLSQGLFGRGTAALPEHDTTVVEDSR